MIYGNNGQSSQWNRNGVYVYQNNRPYGQNQWPSDHESSTLCQLRHGGPRKGRGGGGYMHYDTSRRPILLSPINLVCGISISDFLKICCLEWIAKYVYFENHRRWCGVSYIYEIHPPTPIRKISSPVESMGPRLGCKAQPFASFWHVWYSAIGQVYWRNPPPP